MATPEAPGDSRAQLDPISTQLPEARAARGSIIIRSSADDERAWFDAVVASAPNLTNDERLLLKEAGPEGITALLRRAELDYRAEVGGAGSEKERTYLRLLGLTGKINIADTDGFMPPPDGAVEIRHGQTLEEPPWLSNNSSK